MNGGQERIKRASQNRLLPACRENKYGPLTPSMVEEKNVGVKWLAAGWLSTFMAVETRNGRRGREVAGSFSPGGLERGPSIARAISIGVSTRSRAMLERGHRPRLAADKHGSFEKKVKQMASKLHLLFIGPQNRMRRPLNLVALVIVYNPYAGGGKDACREERYDEPRIY